MTQEQLEDRLRRVQGLIEALHQDVLEDQVIEEATPENIGAVAENCADRLERIKACIDGLDIEIPLRHLEIRGAVRRRRGR